MLFDLALRRRSHLDFVKNNVKSMILKMFCMNGGFNPISPGPFETVNAWGGWNPPPCLSLLLLEIWQPNLAQRLSII